MNLRRKRSHIAGVLGFTMISRAVGFLREMIIAVGFGFSRATDAFYQLAATPTYLITYVTGPFATSYIAWTNGDDAPDERLCRALTRKFLLTGTGLLGAGMLVTTIMIARKSGSPGSSWMPQILMSASCILMGLVGFCSTVSNAKGRFVRAQSILFANNLSFVLLLGLGALAFAHSAELALTSAFAAAALLAAAYGIRSIGVEAEVPHHAEHSSDAMLHLRQSVWRRFLPMLAYASIETLGFLGTQALVLYLASSSGVGVASAGSLAQRIALTTNGLVINPLSNVVMVKLTKMPEAERRGYLVRMVFMTLIGLGAVAAVLSVGSGYLAGLTHSANTVLLAGLIPSYSLWLVAQGTNMMLSRLSFARGAVRLYTGGTLCGYALANVARYLAWKRWGFGAAIAAGSAIELLAALTILLLLAVGHTTGRGQWWRLRTI